MSRQCCGRKFLVIFFFTILFSFAGFICFICLKFSHNWQVKLKSLLNFESKFKVSAKNCLQKEILENSFVKTLNSQIVDLTGKSLVNGVYKKGNTLLKIPHLPEKSKINLCCQQISDFCNKVNSAVYFLLLPTKFQLNGGFADASYFNSYEKDLIQLFYLKLHGRVVNLNSNVFSAYLGDVDFFYRTSSILNSFGNFLVYSSMIKQMGRQQLVMNDFKIKTGDSRFYGDLFNSRFFDSIQPDSIDLFEFSGYLMGYELEFKVRQLYGKNSETERNSIFDYSKLQSFDRVKVFFGDKAPIKLVETNLDEGSLLVFSDGSVDGLMQFLSLHFKNIVVVDLALLKNLPTKDKASLIQMQEMQLKNYDVVLFVYGIESLGMNSFFDQLYLLE